MQSLIFHPHSLFLLLLPALGCGGEDLPLSETDAVTGTTTDTTTDDAPLGDSTGGGADSSGAASDSGSGTSVDSDTARPTTDTSGSDGSTDDGTSGCIANSDCHDADAPFCAGSLCVPCSEVVDPNAACEAISPDTPVCFQATCVQCSAIATSACTGTTPVCDAAANTCIACTAHADCPESACHIAAPSPVRATAVDGSCFDPSNVVHVDGSGGQDFTSIPPAINSFAPGDEGVVIVHDSTSYDDPIIVSQGRVLAIVAAPGESPQMIVVDGSAAHVSVLGAGTTLFLEGMLLYGNNGMAGAAVQVDVGRIHVQRSVIADHIDGAISGTNGAYLHVENSFVGGSEFGASAIHVFESDASILYSTVLAGYGAQARSLSCANPDGVDVRNSILLGETDVDSVNCPTAAFLNNASDQALGAGNVEVPEFDGHQTAWFAGYANSNFHLTSGVVDNGEDEFCAIGSWEDGDPAGDIDGDPRPTIDGTVDCPGADVP